MEYTLYNNDCIQQLKEMEDNSIDSIITDPPYEISFMSKGWDGTGIAFNTEVWQECLRVLKPGGHILAFGGTRTYHRMAVAIEDSGFEIRDCIFWCYGSGFPKSHNIGKKVDEYKGWGTALKPAVEPVVMGRKPFKGSVAQNVLEWGTGGLNIDGCRVGNEERTVPVHSDDVKEDNTLFQLHPTIQHERVATTEGRFPANLILDEEAGKILDTQSGISKSKKGKPRTQKVDGVWTSKGWETLIEYDDEGGASRFFYCPKVSKKERNEGLDHIQPKSSGKIGTTFAGNQTTSKIGANPNKPTKPQQNIHPTIKPVNLLQYLIRLITPKGGVVLDPFMGSGSTGKACMKEGMDFIGIEKEEEYYKIAEARIEYEKNKNNQHKFFE